MRDNWVVVAKASGKLDAEIIRGLLESFEIPVEIVQESAGVVYGLTVGPLGEAQILVPKEFEQRALSALEAYQRGDLADDSEESFPSTDSDSQEA